VLISFVARLINPLLDDESTVKFKLQIKIVIVVV
jgi:hypothetical protein